MGNRTAPPVIQGFVFANHLSEYRVYEWETYGEDPVSHTLRELEYEITSPPLERLFWALYHINGKLYRLNSVAAALIRKAWEGEVPIPTEPFWFRLVRID